MQTFKETLKPPTNEYQQMNINTQTVQKKVKRPTNEHQQTCMSLPMIATSTISHKIILGTLGYFS